MALKTPAPPHDVLVGSYSKLLGMNGIRIGWIATNDDMLAERIKDLVTAEYCGLSSSSTQIVKSALQDFDWDSFEIGARMRLDYNRQQFTRLEKFFQGAKVGPNGMFFYGPMDEKCQELMRKCGVLWTSGTDLGTSEDFGRFNLGQDTQVVKKVVEEVLKTDKSK
jgi:aspartate/methionine/tyrosine aminotransferase